VIPVMASSDTWTRACYSQMEESDFRSGCRQKSPLPGRKAEPIRMVVVSFAYLIARCNGFDASYMIRKRRFKSFNTFYLTVMNICRIVPRQQ
jgi:hypothetical protein